MKLKSWYMRLLVAILLFSGHILCMAKAEKSTDYSFKQLSLEQGLPGSNLRDQLLDSRGIMWIAIEGMGLCRYDGQKFVIYANQADDSTSISSNFVNAIKEDKNGFIWVATDFGLNRYNYNTGSFESFFYSADDTLSIPSNIVISIDCDENGDLWLGTRNGIARIDIENLNFHRLFTVSQNKIEFPTTVYKVLKNNADYLWLGTSYGLVKFNLANHTYKQWDNSNVKASIISSFIFDLLEYKNEKLWIATISGVDIFNIKTEKFEHFKYNDSDAYELDLVGVNRFYMDESNHIWAGTSLKGIIIYNPEDLSYRRIISDNVKENGLKSDHIRYFYQDGQGILWIGTKFGGLFKLNNATKVFNNWPKKYDLFRKVSDLYLIDVFKDKNEVYWIGTKFDGLFKIDLKNNSILNFKVDHLTLNSLPSNRIMKIFRDSENRLWIGTDVGLCLYNEQDGTFELIADTWIVDIFEDKHGNIWVGTSIGIFVVDNNGPKLKKYDMGLKNNFFNNSSYGLTGIYSDNEDNIYFSTRYNGVFVYNLDNGSIGNYSRNNAPETKINANMIRPVFQDSKGEIWIGTKEAGLKHLIKGKNEFETFDINHGLPSNMVLNIDEDREGNLWLGTNNGLSKFDRTNNAFINFNRDYGLKTMVCEQSANFKFEDGALLFGGNNGFNIFYPDSISKRSTTSKLVITSIKSFDRVLYRDVNENMNIVLPFDQNYLSFDFILSDYNDPDRHQFKCYLSNLDDEWKTIGNSHYVSYTNLKPGSYSFKLMGANELGLWNKNPLEITITILKPWWQKWFFRILFFLVFTTLILFIYYWRLRTIRNQKEWLEREVEKRTSELNETNTLLEERQQYIEEQSEELKSQSNKLTNANFKLSESNATKDKLFSIIAHDLRNPFGTVLGFSQLLYSKLDTYDAAKIKQMIHTVYLSTEKIYNLLENLLTWSRAQTNSIKIQPDMIPVNDIIQENVMLLNKQFEQKNIKVNVVSRENKNVYADRVLVNTIIRNLLINAIKYTEHGTITITVKSDGPNCLISIKDSGVGIPPEKLKTLFEIEKSKSTEGTRGEQGTGLGLIICKEFAELNKGKLTVESEVDKGTEFTITLPGETVERKN